MVTVALVFIIPLFLLVLICWLHDTNPQYLARCHAEAKERQRQRAIKMALAERERQQQEAEAKRALEESEREFKNVLEQTVVELTQREGLEHDFSQLLQKPAKLT